jgi:hypothetical protein
LHLQQIQKKSGKNFKKCKQETRQTRVAEPVIVADAHGVEWTRASIEYPPLTGYVPMQTWSVKNMVQDIIVPGQNTAVT